MSGIKAKLTADYFVSVSREGFSWAWEIHRRSRPMGIRVLKATFKTEIGARRAGERALLDFLEGLSETKE
jgi:hypothetical protein